MPKLRTFSPKRICLFGCRSASYCCFHRPQHPQNYSNGNCSYPTKSHRRDAHRYIHSHRHNHIGQKTWRRALIIGGVIFCVYFTLLGFVSFIAISNHRNVRALRFQLVQKNGTLVEAAYGIMGVQANGSLETGAGIITIERVGASRYNLYSKRDSTFVADMIRSQTIFKCVPIHFRKELKSPVALVSFPGSGNTWLRYLLQLATGVFTGSIYKDFALLRNGFPGESITDGRVSVVKTHEIGLNARLPYQKAILLLRKPSEAILAEFNRRAAGHIGHAGRDKYTRNDGRYWSQFVAQKAKSWTETNLDWIQHFNGPLFITMYTHLVQNTTGELRSILEFLEEPATDKVMLCVLENKEGIYRRRKRFAEFNPYSPKMEKFLAAQERIVAKAIEKRIQTRHIQRLGHVRTLKPNS